MDHGRAAVTSAGLAHVVCFLFGSAQLGTWGAAPGREPLERLGARFIPLYICTAPRQSLRPSFELTRVLRASHKHYDAVTKRDRTMNFAVFCGGGVGGGSGGGGGGGGGGDELAFQFHSDPAS